MVYRFGIALFIAAVHSDVISSKEVEDESGLLQGRRKHRDESECQAWYDSASWDSEDADTPSEPKYASSLVKLLETSLNTLAADIRYVTNNPNPCWPQDDSSYGPLFVRLAWHCSGTYRGSESQRQRWRLHNPKGGCTGGRIRFSPEKDWGDNGNLDKARALLKPIKDKYGDGLSWGDLIILAANLFMFDAGAPTTEFCFGRVDDRTNLKSLMLNNECDPNTGDCTEGPLHATLIYVNPAGSGDHMNQSKSADEVTTAFKRMGFTRHETAALVGGGHAFGRAHGAASECSGTLCVTNTVKTSGFHGAWTTNPTSWDNEYFKSLMTVNFVQDTSPAGKPQWVPEAGDDLAGQIFMTNADMAMNQGAYAQSTAMFADEATGQAELDAAFASAWNKLTRTGDGFLPRPHCIQLHQSVMPVN